MDKKNVFFFSPLLQENYIRGIMAYQKEEWKPVINFMEDSLEDYWKQDEKCNADCEVHGEVNGNEFATTVGGKAVGNIC
jgi:hypothetical protein